MTPERWAQIEDLFHRAVECSPERRLALLDQACRDDPELRRQVEGLLSSDGSAAESMQAALRSEFEDFGFPLTGEVVSHYRILDGLGGGGMGLVYRAEDLRLGRLVALKFLPEEATNNPVALARFEREARSASALEHPNICPIYEFGEHEGRSFLVMQLLKGHTLRELLGHSRSKESKPGASVSDQRNMALPLDQVFDLAIQIADGLQAAHQKGIIHRDIKPANIFITEKNVAKILDFGVAKALETDEAQEFAMGPSQEVVSAKLVAPSLTRTGFKLGTVGYMSPEQMRGETLDMRADIFSFGVVLYEMATGRRAFSDETATTLSEAILRQTPVPIRDLDATFPSMLKEIIEKAIAENRDERWQSVTEIRVMLHRVRCELEKGAIAVDGRRASGFADSIVVLPFENSDPEMEYLGDGIAETVINSVSCIKSLRVVPRATAFRYKGKQLDIGQVGRELNVRNVLTGRVNQLGARLIVSVELVDAVNDTHLWGHTYDRKIEDVLSIQQEIAIDISKHSRLHLTETEKSSLTRGSTESREAYLLYLKSIYFANKWTPEGLRKGFDYCRQAIETDPVYANAYTGLAYMYVLAGFFSMGPPAETFARAKAAAVQALRIDEGIANAHAILAFVRLVYDWDSRGSEAELKVAVELGPNLAYVHFAYAHWYLCKQLYNEALAEANLAVDLDPLSVVFNFHLGVFYSFANQHEDAIAQLQKTLELSPAFEPARQALASAYAQQGMVQLAKEEVEEGLNLSGCDLRRKARWGGIQALIGKRQDAYTALRELEQQSAPPHFLEAYRCAGINALLGEKDKTLGWLDKAVQGRSGSLVYIQSDPAFKILHGDPRFAELLHRIGLTQ